MALYRYLNLILSFHLLYVVSVKSCGQFEYQPSKRSPSCAPCRICPKDVHQGGSDVPFNKKCQNKNKNKNDFLPQHIGVNRVAWCSGQEYPLPWCKVWTDDHGHVECDKLNGTINSVCKLVCNPGYIANDIDVESKCDGNLTWSPSRPVCIKNNCTHYEVDHGSVICPVGNVTEGQHCNITCDDGFYLEGDTPICQMNNDGQLGWNRPLPLKCHKFDVQDEESRSKEDETTYIIIGVSVGLVLLVLFIAAIFWNRKTIYQKYNCSKKLRKDSDSSGKSVVSYSKDLESSSDGISIASSNEFDNASVDSDRQRCTELNPILRGNDQRLVINLPELTNENAGNEHLGKVIENPSMMRELGKYLNREQQTGRVTWHLMAEKLNGNTTIDIQHREYKDRCGACFLVLSDFHQSSPDSSLRHVLEFFKTSINYREEGTAEYETHIQLIHQMFAVGNGQDMNTYLC